MSVSKDSTPIDQLHNLGPASARILGSIGITTRADLKHIGPVLAYRALKNIRPGVTLNLLWAMHGALTDQRWDRLPDDTRCRLMCEVEDAMRTPPRGRSI